MADILRQIETYKRKEIAEAKVRMPLHALERKIDEQTPPRGFIRAIEAKLSANQFALIAEITNHRSNGNFTVFPLSADRSAAKISSCVFIASLISGSTALPSRIPATNASICPLNG